MSRFLAMLMGMLLVPGCHDQPKGGRPTDSQPVVTSTGQSDAGVSGESASALLRVAPNVDTTYSADTTKRGDTTFFHAHRTITTYRVIAPAIRQGLAYAVASLPVDSLCPAPMGFNATLIAVDTDITSRLAKTQQCGGRIVLRPDRKLMIGPSPLSPTGCISADSGSARIRRWPWAVIRPYLTSGTIVAIELIDDVAKKAEWCLSVAGVLQQTEKVACTVRDSAPTAALMARALPTQMEGYGPYNCLTTARPQYASPSWYGKTGWTWHPDSFVAIQGRSAAKQKLGILYGINLWTGCGPPASQWPANAPANQVKGRCLPGVLGTSLFEHGWYAPSEQEIARYARTFLGAPKSCGLVYWHFTYAKEQLARPAVRAAIKALADSAVNHPTTSCIQR